MRIAVIAHDGKKIWFLCNEKIRFFKKDEVELLEHMRYYDSTC